MFLQSRVGYLLEDFVMAMSMVIRSQEIIENLLVVDIYYLE